MSDVRPIRSVKPKPCPEIVDVIEDLMRLAKAGDLRGVALVYETRTDSKTANAWAFEEDTTATRKRFVGELENLKLELILPTHAEPDPEGC